MSVEQATFITQLNQNKPAQNELLSEGALHITLIKKVLQDTFPQMDAQVDIAASKLNHLQTAVASTSGADITFANKVSAPVGAFSKASVTDAPLAANDVVNLAYADSKYATQTQLATGTAGVSELTVPNAVTPNTRDSIVQAAAGGATVSGTLTATGTVTANGAATVKGLLTSNGGLSVTNGATALKGTTVDSLTSNGVITAKNNINCSGTINKTSDARLKTNIHNLADGVDELFPVRYEKDGRTEFGVIAQEVAEVFPELVTTTEDGFLAVDYIQFIPLLIKEVKELKHRVNELEG